MLPMPLCQPFTLPCGAVLANRLAKAALTERLSDAHLAPVAAHEQLYERWSRSGAGLLITGNVMVDRRSLESSGNVCFDEAAMLPKLNAWAAKGTLAGNHLWVQISHPGRQASRFSARRPMAPSEVQLKKLGLFGRPRAMTEQDIHEVVAGFVRAARLAQQAGFTGVQIHSAHGYLLSQFLSPHTNRRTDAWGGSLKHRYRLLQAIIRQTRAAVGAAFPISVKLNSSDFQRGGLSEEESLEVVQMLEAEGIDLLEISGGTYENVAFFLMNEEVATPSMKASTRAREAYFLAFAERVRAVSSLPLMVTGGFRTLECCNDALASGALDVVGMGRPFITNLDDIPAFLKGECPRLENLVVRTGLRAFEDAAEGGFYARQLIRLARGQVPKLNMHPLAASVFLVWYELIKALRRKA